MNFNEDDEATFDAPKESGRYAATGVGADHIDTEEGTGSKAQNTISDKGRLSVEHIF